MGVSPSKCPICEKNSVWLGACANCWWEEPSRLRDRADSYELIKRDIIAKRERQRRKLKKDECD